MTGKYVELCKNSFYNQRDWKTEGQTRSKGMKVVIAIDSFKGSLSSLEAGEAAKRGILKCNPQAQVEIRPLADGGEGTVEALVQGMGGRICKVTVTALWEIR